MTVAGANGLNMQFDNLRFVFWTNESNTHLMQITLDQFFKHNRIEGLKVTVFVNNIPENTPLPHMDKVEYLSAGVEYHYQGKHFGQSLLKLLPHIAEEYLFFFCDDYMFIRDTKFNELYQLMQYIQHNDIDYFGFDDMNHWDLHNNFQPEESDESLFQGKLLRRKNSYRYLFSVQPCIWKTSSFLGVIEKYPNVSLHNVDDTLEEIRNQNTLKCYGTELQSFFSYHTNDDFDYFIIAYLEMVRHGVFYHTDNGQPIARDIQVVKFVERIINDYDLRNDPRFTKLLCYI
jgi:hypothetical protein